MKPWARFAAVVAATTTLVAGAMPYAAAGESFWIYSEQSYGQHCHDTYRSAGGYF